MRFDSAKLSSYPAMITMIFIVFLNYSCGDKATTPRSINLNLVGAYEYSSYTREIFVDNRIVYLNCLDSGIVIIDASDPGTPIKASTIGPSLLINGIAVDGGYIYAACGNSGLLIYDISNPHSPVFVGAYNPQDSPAFYAAGITIRDSVAFIGSGYGCSLDIVNVSDPASPARIGRLGNQIVIDQIAISGDFVFARSPGMIESHNIFTIDISDMQDPAQIGSFALDSGGCRHISLFGDYLFFSSLDFPGLTSLDISDPSSPGLYHQLEMPGIVTDLFIVGPNDRFENYAYIADYDSGLQIVDIADPASPYIVESHDIGGKARYIFREGNYIYLTKDDYGLMIFEYKP